MELTQPDEAVEQAALLLQYCRQRAIAVVHVQHISEEADAPFFLPGTRGCDIHPKVQPLAGERVVVKHHANSFRDTRLLAELQAMGATHLLIAGMMTHMCVDSTVRAASDLGFQCTLAQDACATTTLEWDGVPVAAHDVQRAYLAALRDGFASIQPTAAICSAL